jgi:hypothetical protein
MLVEPNGPRLIVVPFPDRTYYQKFELKVLELLPSGVTELAKIAVPSPGVRAGLGDNGLGAAIAGGRVVLRAPGELVFLELGATRAEEVGRVAL